MSGQAYLQAVSALLAELQATQLESVRQVGEVIGRSVADGGIVHLFGSGHSHMAAEEVFVRAGTLTTVRAIWPEQITDKLERVEGLGTSILKMGDVRPGEVLFVISNSGINPMPVDVALEARQHGAVTVAVTSTQHSLAVPSRHSSGRRLMDVCDYLLDTRVPAGDVLLTVPGLGYPIGPASTVASVSLIQAAMAEAVHWLVANGHEPPVRISRNMPGGDAHNDRLGQRYRDRIPELG
ncbi:MAG TPA: SIS domain-containing protein [Symbiobacteriaceae bacterium]|nr:SIS domain-containing protein [Symbiobacteriaceae bacterium]